MPSFRDLRSYWLQDQYLAFAAAQICDKGVDFHVLSSRTKLITEQLSQDVVAILGESTLSLLTAIPEMLRTSDAHDGNEEQARELSDAWELARQEAGRREAGGAKGTEQRINRMLISHAVYVLREGHLTAPKFFKWLLRSQEMRLPGLKALVGKMSPGAEFTKQLDVLLDASRDPSLQPKERAAAVDEFYQALLGEAGSAADEIWRWWTRICLAYRSSLYCWPLLIYTKNEHQFREEDIQGISLPIGLSLREDYRSTDRQFVEWTLPPQSRLNNAEGGWRWAFRVGMGVAKSLWLSQNGRLRRADPERVRAKLASSLVVDMTEAGTIVDTVYASDAPGQRFVPAGRSAEAYWAQVVLGLLLPRQQIPMGVVTGRIDVGDSSYELRNVAGIWKKLEYADRAGFPRVIVPGSQEDYAAWDEVKESVEEEGDEENETTPVNGQEPPEQESSIPSVLRSGIDAEQLDGAQERPRTGVSEFESLLAELTPERLAKFTSDELTEFTPEQQVKLFLRKLSWTGSSKSVEINLCQNARAAADAMQASGWRRTAFLRLPETQGRFGLLQRWLHCDQAIRKNYALSNEDREFHHQMRGWGKSRRRKARDLDRTLLGRTGRTIEFVGRASLGPNAEALVGEWLAWKDHQVRVGDGSPGLGILAFRTADGDNEVRLWAAVADMLDADPLWWDRFRWSGREGAAERLAELLDNTRRVNIHISVTPAPDLLVIFDDGNFTRRTGRDRTNSVFPTDFNLQFLDILNPWMEDRYAVNVLDRDLRKQGDGPFGQKTRIIVIYNESAPPGTSPLEQDMDHQDRESLESLSVFRFGFSSQAAYSALNGGAVGAHRIRWKEAQRRLKVLRDKKLLWKSRNQFFLSRAARALVGNSAEGDPDAHLHAARALCPIIQPSGQFLASNRDRQLEPEAVLEAAWHLDRAYDLTKPRFRKRPDPISEAWTQLTFLRIHPDWDTVKELREAYQTLRDAVELAKELISVERTIARTSPHSSKVSLLFETSARLYDRYPPKSKDYASELDDIRNYFSRAIDDMNAFSESDDSRQNRLLYSRFLICLRKLNIGYDDPMLGNIHRYLQNVVWLIMRKDFLEEARNKSELFYDFTIPRDYWRLMWSDPDLSLDERSRCAYAAARVNAGLWLNDKQQTWDEPWVQYFRISRFDQIETNQIVGPLTEWYEVNRTLGLRAFGHRILMSKRQVMPNRSDWFDQILESCENLWRFCVSDGAYRCLYGAPLSHALNFIRVIALPETLPAFCFVDRCGLDFHRLWPSYLEKPPNSAWKTLAADVIASEAGWVSMLSSLPNDGTELRQVRSWLRAYEDLGCRQPRFDDPEELIARQRFEPAQRYARRRHMAIANGRRVIAALAGDDNAVQLLRRVLQPIDRRQRELSAK